MKTEPPNPSEELSGEEKNRTLKVYYRYNDTGRCLLPMIRLQGKYLSKCGFNIGERLKITLDTGEITIRKALPEAEEREQEMEEKREQEIIFIRGSKFKNKSRGLGR